MKSRKLVAVGVCGMVGLGMMQSASAADTSENEVVVSYDYSGTAEPVSPNYDVSIPTGLVFDAKDPTKILTIDVEIKPAQGQGAISSPSKVDVSVKSANEYFVQLADGSDKIPYVVKYEGVELTGQSSVKIGTLAKNAQGTLDKEKLKGTAKLKGVATQTGAHIDTLTYTITNVTTN